MSDHHRSTNGYVREHILVMEDHLKRKLTDDEVIHHIDGNRKNNKIENLMIFKKHSDHMKIENVASNIRLKGKVGTKYKLICNYCDKSFLIPGFQYRSNIGKFCSVECYHKFRRVKK